MSTRNSSAFPKKPSKDLKNLNSHPPKKKKERSPSPKRKEKRDDQFESYRSKHTTPGRKAKREEGERMNAYRERRREYEERRPSPPLQSLKKHRPSTSPPQSPSNLKPSRPYDDGGKHSKDVNVDSSGVPEYYPSHDVKRALRSDKDYNYSRLRWREEEKEESKPKKWYGAFLVGLNYSTNEDTLIKCFSHIGKVVYCRVLRDRGTNHSLGNAFVDFSSEEERDEAIRSMTGAMIDGHEIIMRMGKSWNNRHDDVERHGEGNKPP